MLIGGVDVQKLASGHKVALHIVHAAFHLALVSRRTRAGRTDHKAIVLCHAPVGFAKHWIVDQDLDHCCFQIIDDDPSGHTTPALERASMQANPGWRLLVEDQLRILVAAIAQGGDKGVGPA